ncbi:hypothetical protein [Shouchella lonarensis]|uniref:Uncharacterized protein n=1 Tax=Shouchella lonarensis TaxID=1464122 RepID=A0A1G6GL39_9BACI|nr:hypothetical protein [Shouchella lonarensis]SDB82644.1 hypothetical protein SAMN05421737_101203 [Shouchella lonarensis]
MWNDASNKQGQSYTGQQNPFGSKKQSKITPTEIAIVTALLTNALSVQSILIDREQTVQVLLEGSLKNQQELARLMEQMKDIPVGDLFSSMLYRK